MGQRCHICHTGEQGIRLRSRAGPWGAEAGESGPLQQGGHGCVPCGRTWCRPAERSGTGAGRKAGRLEHLNQVDPAKPASPRLSPGAAGPAQP